MKLKAQVFRHKHDEQVDLVRLECASAQGAQGFHVFVRLEERQVMPVLEFCKRPVRNRASLSDKAPLRSASQQRCDEMAHKLGVETITGNSYARTGQHTLLGIGCAACVRAHAD